MSVCHILFCASFKFYVVFVKSDAIKRWKRPRKCFWTVRFIYCYRCQVKFLREKKSSSMVFNKRGERGRQSMYATRESKYILMIFPYVHKGAVIFFLIRSHWNFLGRLSSKSCFWYFFRVGYFSSKPDSKVGVSTGTYWKSVFGISFLKY